MAEDGNDFGSLVTRLGDVLGARSAWLGLAESCTGGWASKVITDVAGVSAWFWGGIVVYDVDAKTRLLGVPAELVARAGVVSNEVVAAMARGLLDLVPKLTHAAAVSGVAGPGGGGRATPVGTVCFAWAERGGPCRTKKLRLPGGREEVRREAVRLLLEGVLDPGAGREGA